MNIYIEDLPGDYFRDESLFEDELKTVISGYAMRLKRNFKIRFSVPGQTSRDYAVFPEIINGLVLSVNSHRIERNKLFWQINGDL